MVISIALPNCKSILIRQLIHRFVSDGAVLPMLAGESTDVQVTWSALNAIAKNQPKNSDFHCESVNIEDCGAAFRFLMALLSVTPGRWFLTGTEHLQQRPIQELLDVLVNIGAKICPAQNGWLIEGQSLKAEELTINCSKSSQFASALLLVAPRLGLKTLHLQPIEIPSKPYIQLTRACLDYEVNMPDLDPKPKALGKSGDWSAAAFWYAFAVLHPGQEFLLENLSLDSAQGDAIVAKLFEPLGVQSRETPTGILISASEVNFPAMIRWDMSDHLDLVPVMVALACQLPIRFVIENVHNLQYKESDRTSALLQLKPFAENMEVGNGVMEVVGKEFSKELLNACCFDTYNDHRLAMAFLLLGEHVKMNNMACLGKSYPGLIKQLEKVYLQIEK